MDNGAAPRPRRSAPRPLVGATEYRRPSETGASTGARLPRDREGPTPREQELQERLELEGREKKKLQLTLRDFTAKFERTLGHQTRLEEDLIARDAHIQLMSDELRILKQRKQSSDNELAQSTADYMNSQAKWLEQVDQLNDEIQVLKTKLSDVTTHSKGLEQECMQFREKERQREAEEQDKVAKANRPDNVQVAANALEKHQNELLIDELRARHTQIRSEMMEVKSMNDRLREENERFQYLLIEHTVAGDIPTLATNASGQQTLAEDDVLEFDPSADMPGVSGADSSLADEGNPQSSLSTTPISVASDSGAEKDIKHLQKTINQQQFELQSLRNHNQALKLSLERLVDRLLDNKSFNHVVEEAVSSSVVKKFRQRVASSSFELDRLTRRESNDRSASPARRGTSSIPAATWSAMIFNTQHSGTPNRRVLSMGVDNEYKAPPAPLQSQHTGNTIRTISTTGSSELAPSNRIKLQVGRTPSGAQSPEDTPTRIQVAKRTDSQSGLRKLRLKV